MRNKDVIAYLGLWKKLNYDFKYSLNQLLYHVNKFPKDIQTDIMFNLGGVSNHNIYWKSMNSKRSLPEGKYALDKEHGDYNNFWNTFKNKVLSLKGSVYTYLVLKKDGKLDVINVSNQDYPLSLGYVPLFNIDLWEDAYYINYENEKERYIDNFEKIADFTYANSLYNNFIK